MKLQTRGDRVTVTRDDTDKRIYSESAFWYAVRNTLRGSGRDVVKRLMQKDGHMMGDNSTYYVRARNWDFAIFDGDWAVRDLAKDYRENGTVILTRQSWSK